MKKLKEIKNIYYPNLVRTSTKVKDKHFFGLPKHINSEKVALGDYFSDINSKVHRIYKKDRIKNLKSFKAIIRNDIRIVEKTLEIGKFIFNSNINTKRKIQRYLNEILSELKGKNILTINNEKFFHIGTYKTWVTTKIINHLKKFNLHEFEIKLLVQHVLKEKLNREIPEIYWDLKTNKK